MGIVAAGHATVVLVRSVLAAVLFTLALVPSARADVFVPADPPDVAGAECAAQAGDLLAVGDSVTTRVRAGVGPWTTLEGFHGCPEVAAAADGTALILGRDLGRLVLRRPDGTLGAPVDLGETPSPDISVAVAPGGWAVATWVEERELLAQIMRPDGTLARTVVDRVGSTGFLSTGVVGIDAAGTATMIWRRYSRREERTRVARLTAGGPLVASADLPEAIAFDLAVRPGGGTLLAWTGRDGVHAQLDGGAPQLVDPGSGDAETLSATLGDGGSAVLAYLRENDELVAVERPGGAAWQAPRVLWSAGTRYPQDRSDEAELVRTTLDPGGRAVVAWVANVNREPHVFAALGQLGGAWAPAARLSSIARPGYAPSLTVDGSGAPRVLWSEGEAGIRGATLAAAPADTAAPVVTADFPARLARTRDGRLSIRVRVRCSEACDLRLSIAPLTSSDLIDDFEPDVVAQLLRAGEPMLLRLRTAGEVASELVRNPRSRRLRLRLVATDRTGNLTRRSASVRVRVIEKPIRALKVAPTHDFAMKTPAGNRLVATLVNDLIERAARGGTSDDALRRRYERGRTEIRRAGHREITTSRVGIRIFRALDIPLSRAGLNPNYVLS